MDKEKSQIQTENLSESTDDILEIIHLQNKIIKKILRNKNVEIDNENKFNEEIENTQSENEPIT